MTEKYDTNYQSELTYSSKYKKYDILSKSFLAGLMISAASMSYGLIDNGINAKKMLSSLENKTASCDTVRASIHARYVRDKYMAYAGLGVMALSLLGFCYYSGKKLQSLEDSVKE